MSSLPGGGPPVQGAAGDAQAFLAMIRARQPAGREAEAAARAKLARWKTFEEALKADRTGPVGGGAAVAEHCAGYLANLRRALEGVGWLKLLDRIPQGNEDEEEVRGLLRCPDDEARREAVRLLATDDWALAAILYGVDGL